MKIEKGIPVPPRLGRPPKYRFDEMERGDSFFAPVQPSTLQGCLRRARPDLGKRQFTVRGVEEHGVIGARCWRVA
jgi:hypothetical protein